MNFAEVLASMGEAGELGENPRLPLSTGEARERRIRPTTCEGGELFAPIRPAIAQPKTTPINDIRPNRPIRPEEADEIIHLVKICGKHYGFTEQDFTEAITAALNDPDAALTCFRAIANEIGVPPISRPSQMRKNAP